MPFNKVDAGFAFREGEGDKSLNYWREAHVKFFTKELGPEGIPFSEDMLVVCEEFEVEYAAKGRKRKRELIRIYVQIKVYVNKSVCIKV